MKKHNLKDIGTILISVPFIIVYLIVGILLTLTVIAVSLVIATICVIAFPFVLLHGILLAIYEAIVDGPEKSGDI